MPTVLIGAEAIRRDQGPFRQAFSGAGFECLDPPGHAPLSEAEMLHWLPMADAILAGGEPISRAAILAAPKLRAVARVGVGYEAVDLGAAEEAKVAVAITPGANHESVAEHAFGLILSLLRRIAANDRIVRKGGWERAGVLPVRGKVLGLVGLGRIGRAMIPRAQAFAMKTIGFDPALGSEQIRTMGVEPCSFDQLLEQADVVSLHLPLSSSTRKLMNQETIRKMRTGAYLVNTSRGGLVDEAALFEALTSGKLGGAGLDVFDPEPPKADNPLFQLESVVLAPHVAGIDAKALADMALIAAEAIISLHQGRWPADLIVNPSVASNWRW